MAVDIKEYVGYTPQKSNEVKQQIEEKEQNKKEQNKEEVILPEKE